MPRLFISYSRRDVAFVRRLAGDLETAGYDVWWDVSNLRGGDEWLRVIPAAIRSSDFFIVVLSPNSALSEWVEKEYTQALSLHKKIIPIMLEKSDVPFALNTINYIDFMSGDYAASLNHLLNALGYGGESVIPTTASAFKIQKFAIPFLLLGVLLLFVFQSPFFHTVQATPTSTPTSLPSRTPFETSTFSPTVSPTMTFTFTVTGTPLPSPTLTTSATLPTFDILIYCVNSLYANTINVRSGPGVIYAPFGEPLQVGKCLAFNARNSEGTWLQIAPEQTDPLLEQYAHGWIFRELLGLGTSGPIDLPVVTLTPTRFPSETPISTTAVTSTSSPSPTETETPSPAP